VQRASQALAAGALDTRVGGPVNRRKDEVGALARDFDRMAERIQAFITDKETLLRDVSHELRSPLARMRVALALAQRKTPEAAQPNLLRIELEAERLDGLVGQIMTLSRLRTATEPTRNAVQLGEIVAAVVDDARFEHPDRLVNYTPPAPIAFTGDPDGLKSAVENVVRNALAYSPADKPIDVTLEQTPSAIEIRVRDRGPGVEPQHLQRIFEPFYRTDESRDHRQDGQGIGLAITARVMELHGGSVEAANRADGDGGLQITLQLPLEKDASTHGERGGAWRRAH
jgi:two-component system sensor histidine kinase CpxA